MSSDVVYDRALEIRRRAWQTFKNSWGISPPQSEGSYISQCFSFNMNLDAMYPRTATQINQIIMGNREAQMNYKLLLIFLYLCAEFRTYVVYPRPPPQLMVPDPPADEDEDDEHEDEMFDDEPTGKKRKRQTTNKPRKRPQNEATASEKLSSILLCCKQLDIDISKIDLEDISDSVKGIVQKLAGDIEEQTDIHDDALRIFCYLEYVPCKEAEQPERSFIYDIFNDDDPFRSFNNLLLRQRAVSWTLHFQTLSKADFNHGLNRLLAINLFKKLEEPESCASLSSGQEMVISGRVNPDRILGVGTRPKSMRGGGRGGFNSALRSKEQKRLEVLPWNAYHRVGNMELAAMADLYMGTRVCGAMSTKRNIEIPSLSTDSPMNANNLFSEFFAIKNRPADLIPQDQTLASYQDARLRTRMGLVLWKPSNPNRVRRVSALTFDPARFVVRHFPDHVMMTDNPFLREYPSLDPVNMADPDVDRQKTVTRRIQAPQLPTVNGTTYEDSGVLRTIINSMERHLASGRAHERRVFAIPMDELDNAKCELVRYEQEKVDYTLWRETQKTAASVFFEGRSKEFMDMINDEPGHSASRRGDCAQEVEPFSISDYILDPENRIDHHEQIGILRAENLQFLSILKKKVLDNQNNGLTQKERCAIYRIYQMQATKRFEATAHGPLAPIPDAARMIYDFVERTGLYDPSKRPRVLRKTDPSMDTLSNFMAWCLGHYKITLNAARPDLVQMSFLCAMDASRHDFALKTNILFVGKGGVSKSWNFKITCEELLIEGTWREETSHTDKAMNTNARAKDNYMVHIQNEMPKKSLMGDGEDGVGDPVLKQVLDVGRTKTLAAHWDPITGNVENRVRQQEMLGVLFACFNGLNHFHDSVNDRVIQICLPENPNINDRLLSEFSKRQGDRRFDQDLSWIHRFIQAVHHDICMLIGTCCMPAPSTTLMTIFIFYINRRLRDEGMRTFRPRDIMKMCAMASNLCIIDAIVSEFLYAGGRFYNQPVTCDALLSLAPRLFVARRHAVQTIKIASRLMIMHGEGLVRTALMELSENKRRTTHSADACYAAANRDGSRGAWAGPEARGGPRNSDSDSVPTAFQMVGCEKDWNYHFYPFGRGLQSFCERLHMLIKGMNGAEQVSTEMIGSIIEGMTHRIIEAKRYVRNPQSDPMEYATVIKFDPERDTCLCAVGQNADCTTHKPIRIPVMERTNVGLFVSSYWLHSPESRSTEQIIDDALRDLFNHRHQDSFKCVAEPSSVSAYNGTHDVFEVEAPPHEVDTRPLLHIPNLSCISDIEHQFLHAPDERNVARDASEWNQDQQQIEDAGQQKYWTSPQYVLDESFDLYAADAHLKKLYMCGETVTMRDVVSVFYTFGKKCGLVDERSPLFNRTFDPNSALLERYDNERDIDVPDDQFMVPSRDDPKQMVSVRELIGADIETFKYLCWCEAQELRFDAYSSAQDGGFIDYPHTIRSNIDRQASERSLSGQALIALSGQISLSSTQMQTFDRSHNIARSLRAQYLDDKRRPYQKDMDYADGGSAYSTPRSRGSPYTTSPCQGSPVSRVLGGGPGYHDNRVPDIRRHLCSPLGSPCSYNGSPPQ